MLSEVGIGPKSLCYGFLNEIVAHPWSEGGHGITRIGCTKFCEGCTKGLKMVPKWGSTPNHFVMGFLRKLWTIHVEMGVSESVRLDVPNLMKDVPNFLRMYQGFQSAFQGGDQPPITSLWVSKGNHGPSMFR